MKRILTIAAFSLFSLPHAMAEEIEAPPQAELADQPPEWIQQDAAKTEPIPKAYAELNAVSIVVEKRGWHEEDEQHLLLRLRLINPTDKRVWFTGYNAGDPLTSDQHWIDGKWHQEIEGICGTGLRDCSLAPGQSVVFEASFDVEQLPARVGLYYKSKLRAEDHKQVWSEKIEK